jgi:Trk K+ transport system NAD-binding subunit
MQYKTWSPARRLLALLALLPLTVLILGTLYMLGMDHLEGSPRTLLQALQWASETMTNTGYGADNRWNHPVMAMFVIITPFIGQCLVFLIFPVLMLPYFEDKFEVRLPQVLPPMDGRVLFYRYGPAIESVVVEFENANSPFVILEEDMNQARSLRDRGFNVVLGNLAADPSVLAPAAQARAVVTNSNDHANATCTLLAREYGFTGPLFALANDPLYRAPMVQIGATEVFTPAHVLGAALASRASHRISPPAEGMHLLGARVGMAEFRVRADSALAGKRLGDLRLRERHGVAVIGQWFGGLFTTAKGPDTQVQPGAILVVVGVHEGLGRRAHGHADPPRRPDRAGRLWRGRAEGRRNAARRRGGLHRDRPHSRAWGGCGRQRAGARQPGQSPRARGQRGGAGASGQHHAGLGDDLLVRVVGRLGAGDGALGLHIVHKALGVEQVGVDVTAGGVDGRAQRGVAVTTRGDEVVGHQHIGLGQVDGGPGAGGLVAHLHVAEALALGFAHVQVPAQACGVGVRAVGLAASRWLATPSSRAAITSARSGPSRPARW